LGGNADKGFGCRRRLFQEGKLCAGQAEEMIQDKGSFDLVGATCSDQHLAKLVAWQKKSAEAGHRTVRPSFIDIPFGVRGMAVG